MDKFFAVSLISQMENPQQVCWSAMRQDYCEDPVTDFRDRWPSEEKCGEYVVEHCLKGDKGHFGIVEHPQIVLNFKHWPHSVMQQVRTHRNVSFDIQSFRYTGTRISDVAEGKRTVEEVFYLRPPGFYTDRKGAKYTYSREEREDDLLVCLGAAKAYQLRIQKGQSEEHARGLIPFDCRQSWVMSANARSLMHLFDLRASKAAQLETQQLCDLSFPYFKDWMPAVAGWYEQTRWGKARLAP